MLSDISYILNSEQTSMALILIAFQDLKELHNSKVITIKEFEVFKKIPDQYSLVFRKKLKEKDKLIFCKGLNYLRDISNEYRSNLSSEIKKYTASLK